MKIDPYAHLLALIRQRAPIAAPGAVARPLEKNSARAAPVRRFDMGRSIIERIREISPDDPRRRRKAFRAFLEGALAEELGATLLTDPDYQRLVDLTLEQMEAEPSLKQPIDRAIDMLLG